MVDRDACVLYELYDARYSSTGSTAGSGAVFDLRSNHLRPATWTSADAAGLPILAGLLRLDEVRAGSVDHAIRVTASATDRSYLWPAQLRLIRLIPTLLMLPPQTAWWKLPAKHPGRRTLWL